MVVAMRIWRKFQKQISNGKHLTMQCRGMHYVNDGVVKVAHEQGTARMFAWQIHSYGSLEELQFTNSARSPTIMSPDDVLVKVQAASINPLDVRMISGYGASLLNTLRQIGQFSFVPEVEFPLIMGRDCCGQVIAKGNNVGKNLNVGDVVYGVIPVHLQGCHAENVIMNKDLIRKKPNSITVEEASSLMFAGMSAWSALKISGDLWLMPSLKTKRVLVIGASGGVGSIAVQLLKCWGAEVVAVCNSDAINLAKALNCDHTIDYKSPGYQQEVDALGKYDIIFDAAGIPVNLIGQYVDTLKQWSLAKFITMQSPFLKNVDEHGLFPGICMNAKDILMPNLTTGAVTRGTSVRWAFFMPVPYGFDELHELISTQRIKPVVQKIFKMNDLPLAYKTVHDGHLRGKIVVSMKNDDKTSKPKPQPKPPQPKPNSPTTSPL